MTGAVRNRGGMPSFIALLAATLVVFTASPAAAVPAVPPTTTEVIAGQYLVTIAPVDHGSERVVAAQLASAHHLTVLHLYEHAVQGFAARMTDDEAGALRADPRVTAVEPDRSAHLDVRNVSPESDPPTRFASEPSAPASGSGVRVYVIDTGVDADAPALVGRASLGVDVVGTPITGTACNAARYRDRRRHRGRVQRYRTRCRHRRIASARLRRNREYVESARGDRLGHGQRGEARGRDCERECRRQRRSRRRDPTFDRERADVRGRGG